MQIDLLGLGRPTPQHELQEPGTWLNAWRDGQPFIGMLVKEGDGLLILVLGGDPAGLNAQKLPALVNPGALGPVAVIEPAAVLIRPGGGQRLFMASTAESATHGSLVIGPDGAKLIHYREGIAHRAFYNLETGRAVHAPSQVSIYRDWEIVLRTHEAGLDDTRIAIGGAL